MHPRRKRRRITRPSTKISSSVIIKNEAEQHQSEVGYKLENLPPEILEMIFRLLPLADVSTSIRLVSRLFSSIASNVLNAAFVTAATRLETTMKYIEKTKLSEATTSRDIMIWNRALNICELIKSQYKMLKAVTWRYTHPLRPANFNRVCFYAGSLMDEFDSILNVIRRKPWTLFSFSSSVSNRMEGPSYNEVVASSIFSSRIVSFLARSKQFMNYFEKTAECKLNRSPLISGCKAVDILDCLAVGREVTGFRVSSNRTRKMRLSGDGTSRDPYTDEEKIERGSIVTMGLRYVMQRAWFTCLKVPCAPDENSWREDQRLMYLRLRRLVGSVNEHYFQKYHFEKDLLLRTSSLIALRNGRREVRVEASQLPRPPPASTYSGYGIYAGRFFYYGNMNKYAYDSKFKNTHWTAVLSSDESSQDDEGTYNGDETENRRTTSSTRRGFPIFDLVIKVDLRCSSELAPLTVISNLRTSELDDEENLDSRSFSRSHHDEIESDELNSELYIKLNISCPASAANRLPSSFTWEQREPSHSRRKCSNHQLRLSH